MLTRFRVYYLRNSRADPCHSGCRWYVRGSVQIKPMHTFGASPNWLQSALGGLNWGIHHPTSGGMCLGCLNLNTGGLLQTAQVQRVPDV